MSTRAVAPRRDWQLRRGQDADQDNFIPFILETGGHVNKAARDWLDTLTAPKPDEQVPSQDDHPWNPQRRTTTRPEFPRCT